MEKFFRPESIAVIGASNSLFNLGATILKGLRRLDYKADTYAVNRKGEDVCGYKGVKSVTDISGPVDLAIIIIQAAHVPAVMQECGEKGIKHVIIESAGFSEEGDAGQAIQARVSAIAAQYGIRYMGPNCLGVLDAHAAFCCFFGSGEGTYADIFLNPGSVTYIVQSGGVGVLMMDSLMEDIAGINKVISIGNKADIDEADLLEFLEADPQTEVICMYLENVQQGRRLLEAAARVTKPVLVYKVGRTAEGARAAMSHTAGMANDDLIFERAMQQAGIIRAGRIGELHALPKVFTSMPLMKGRRVAVFTNSGAFGGIATDIVVEAGFEMARFPEDVQLAIRNSGQVYNSANPIDLGPELSAEAYIRIFDIMLGCDAVDGLVALPSVWQDFVIDALDELVNLCRRHDKPAVIYVPNGINRIIAIRKQRGLPLYESPEEAVRALQVSLLHYRCGARKCCGGTVYDQGGDSIRSV